MHAGLFAASRHCLTLADPAAKCAAVQALEAAYCSGAVRFDPGCLVDPISAPGRPDRPPLVDASRVPRRRLGSAGGRAALVHAIAHIEFNAINLALDAMYRFRGMPAAYYTDWLSVAVDEARHFQLLEERLRAMGKTYGDFPAHNGLWEMAEKTADSCLVRMALVPRVLEARGLDVTPGMIERLQAAGDEETVAVLRVILAEEVRHVAIGTQWFRYCCEQEALEPSATFLDLLEHRYAGAVRGPFNLAARYAAGFTQEEMAALGAL
ncbi:MAG: ferritin-like domain-containing protein [Lysobacterales bacterium]